jgi:hypothetical protein
MARVFAHKSFNWAFVVVLMFTVAGWSTIGFGQAAQNSGSLQGAFNVTVKFDDPNIPGCVSPTMNTADGESWRPDAPSRKAPDTASGSGSARAALQ